MPDPADNRVAVYIDFDNIVISRYNQLHGVRRFTSDGARNFDSKSIDAVGTRIAGATIDIGAILDFASSFGSVAISRAYADWSAKVNADYRQQLIDRAVDLTQLFTTTQQMKNGADIRLAVDVVEDLFRQSDLTHVIIVAGDSDYIALAQRCKRLGRYVVGIGVAGSTSKALAAACNEFADYDALPGISGPAEPDETEPDETELSETEPSGTGQGVMGPGSAGSALDAVGETRGRLPRSAAGATDTDEQEAPGTTVSGLSSKAAGSLLVRALRLGLAKEDADWMQSSILKNQMLRMDPTFNEASLGFGSFTEFVKSRNSQVEMDDGGPNGSRRVRLRPSAFTGQ
jgi:hypothetical protein